MYRHRRCWKWLPPASIHSCVRLIMLRYTRCNIVILMAATGDTWTVRYTNQIRTRYRNWRTTSATQLQPSKSLCYIGYTATCWQYDCWLTVQTLYAIYILTSERISQGHVQNGRWATFSWPILYYAWKFDLFSGAFAKWRKATIRFVMSDCKSAWNNSAPTAWI